MSIIHNHSIAYIDIECYNCGVIFSVSNELDQNFRKTKKLFYCPNGHGQSYTKGTAEILSEQLQDKKNRVFELENEVARLERKLKRKPCKRK